MELAPYLYKENGYETKELIDYLLGFKYKFYDTQTLKKIDDIHKFTKNINDG